MKLEGSLQKKNNRKVAKPEKPLISVITVVFNGAKTIEDTIESVKKQSYDNVEHIIIDGGSIDGTVEILRKHNKFIGKWISEKDEGIYDAMNKGIKLSSGDIIGILNSDDFFASENIIDKIADVFIKTSVDAVYGDLEYVDSKDTTKVIRYWKSSKFKVGSFKRGWHPPHPSLFIKKDIYNKYGNFDTNMKVSADFELMLRFFENHRISVHYLHEVIVKMRIGGESNRSIENRLTGTKSIMKAFQKNNISINKVEFLLRRWVPKIRQYWQRKS